VIGQHVFYLAPGERTGADNPPQQIAERPGREDLETTGEE
jgi:hypothetical protein